MPKKRLSPPPADDQPNQNEQWWEQMRVQHSARARYWLYLGVGALGLIIILMWGASFKLRLEALKENGQDRAGVIDSAKQNWETVFDSGQTAADQSSARQQINATLNKIFSSQENGATATTAAPLPTGTPSGANNNLSI